MTNISPDHDDQLDAIAAGLIAELSALAKAEKAQLDTGLSRRGRAGEGSPPC